MVRSCAGGTGQAASPETLPTTAYFLEGERCSRDCGFCAQARSASSRDDLLSRVNWPAVGSAAGGGTEVDAPTGPDLLWRGLGQAAAQGRLRRACFQVTVAPGVLAKTEEDVRRLRDACPGLPVCVCAWTSDLKEIARLLGRGVERVTLALDAVSPGVYRAVKGGSLEGGLSFLARAARRFPGHVGTHVMAGLGETEKEMVLALQTMTDLGVTAALFAFTPISGTRLEGRRPPELRCYRRLQAARFLVSSGYVRAEAMSFDGEGRVASFGRPWREVRRILAGDGSGAAGRAFQTSGCPDCNRPYYNERASGALYNYPRPLTAAEAERAIQEAAPVGAKATSSRVARVTGPTPSAWRLLAEERPRTGAENMAVDEAILLAHAAGRVPPTLRFYRWDPPAVSLGYFQDPRTDVDWERCRRTGLDVVRRPTGGRAVLHDREVTYAVVVATALFPGTVLETYRRLAGGLVLGLREMGFPALLAPEEKGPGAPPDASGACFEVPSSYEIVVGGRKVVGSAQVRRQGVILQHGSILLEVDAALLARVLGLPPAAAARIAARAAGLAELAGRRGAPHEARGAPTYEEVCRAVAKGFETALEVRPEPGRLSPGEAAAVERLVREKYGHVGWNLRRPEAEREEA